MQSVKPILHALRVLDEDILHEAANQPWLFVQAARYRVAKMREHYAAKAALEEYETDYSLTIRHKMKEKGEKSTETHIKSVVRKRVEYTRLKFEMHQAEAREEFAKLLLEAMKMRRDAIRIITGAEFYEGIRSTAEVERVEQHRRLTKEARRLQEKFRRSRADEE